MPIVGEALCSPFFNKFEVEAEISLTELLKTAPLRREPLRKRIRKMAKDSDPEMAVAIYSKTIKEVAGGSMSGPFTEAELGRRFGHHWNLVPAFGVHQEERMNRQIRSFDGLMIIALPGTTLLGRDDRKSRWQWSIT